MIIKELDKRVSEYKSKYNYFEYGDISSYAIELVKNNTEIREEIKNNLNEIMIDEYQDTNDVQEEFIAYISNNNVYMVGDIKLYIDLEMLIHIYLKINMIHIVRILMVLR